MITKLLCPKCERALTYKQGPRNMDGLFFCETARCGYRVPLWFTTHNMNKVQQHVAAQSKNIN